MSELTMGIKSKALETKRPKRTPLGQRNRLSFGNQDSNFVYRVVNDQDDRLEQALTGGYEFVVSDKDLGDKRAAEGGKVDSRVSKPVGNGPCMIVLMGSPVLSMSTPRSLASPKSSKITSQTKPLPGVLG